MTLTRQEIDDHLDHLQDILNVRVRFSNTYQSVSANLDLEEGNKRQVVRIRWYDHLNEELRKMECDRVTIIPVEDIKGEIDHQKEELFEDLSDEDINVLREVL